MDQADALERAMQSGFNLEDLKDYDNIPPSRSQWPGDESYPDSETEEEARQGYFFLANVLGNFISLRR